MTLVIREYAVVAWRGFLAVALAFVLTAAADRRAAAQDRALIVALDKLADGRIADLPGKLAENDAVAMEKLLTGKLGFKKEEIKILRNEQATRKAILTAFHEWLNPNHPGSVEEQFPRLIGLDESGALDAGKGKKPKQKKKTKWKPPPKVYRSFFYFAGLGSTQPDDNGDETDGRDETLIPYDAKLDTSVVPSVLSGMISDDELEKLLSGFRNRHVRLVLDTSHSGFVTRSLNLAGKSTARVRVARSGLSVRSIEADEWLAAHKAEGAFVQASIPGGSLEVWSAASPTQTALIAGPDEKPSGLFTLLFVEGLEDGKADRNSNGIISNAELLAHVTAGSDIYCRTFDERCEMGLKPRLDPPSAYGRSAWVDRKKVSHGQERRLTYKRLLDFLAGYETGKLEIIQTPPSPVRVGEKDIRYDVTTREPGYVVLLNLTDDGSLFQLYPNRYSGTRKSLHLNLVRAGTPLRVPDTSYGVTLSATEEGAGHIVAIMTPNSVAFDQSVTAREIASVSDDEAIGHYLARLSAALHQPMNQSIPSADTGKARWHLQALPYEIKPKKATAHAN